MATLSDTNIRPYPFRDKGDLERLFQNEINRFPIVDGRRQIAEFGGMMIRPIDQSANRLSQIVFPETTIALPSAAHSLKQYSSRTMQRIELMARIDSNELFLRLIAAHETPDKLIEHLSLIVPMREVALNCDLWATVSPDDQEELKGHGFGPGMSHEDWAHAIDKFQYIVRPSSFAQHGGSVKFRNLPIAINQCGVVGIIDSYFLMPEFIASVLESNRFVFEGIDIPDIEADIPYEIGSAHVHPKLDFQGIELDIVKAVGAETIQLTASPLDIADMRQSRALNSEINLARRNRDINTFESFLGIIGLDDSGNVAASRYLDFVDIGNADERRRMSDLNDRTVETMRSAAPKIELIKEHYRYFDRIMKDNFGPGTTSDHVGTGQ